MSFLSRVSSGMQMRPLRGLLHGHPGNGKTTLAASFPKPVVLTTEDGLGLLDVDSLPMPDGYDELFAILQEIGSEDHEYRTLVVDAVDGIEPFIWQRVCAEQKAKDINDLPYSRGYMFADAHWARLFHMLDGIREQRKMNIVLISHSEAVTVDDPVNGSYVRWSPNIHKRAVKVLTKWCDLIGFLDIERFTDDKGDKAGKKTVRSTDATGRRYLHVEDAGGFIAKNRYALPQSKYEIPQHDGWGVLSAAIQATYAEARERAEGTTNEEAA